MKINFKSMLMLASATALVATACTKEPVQPEEPQGSQEPEVVVETITAELLELPNLAWAEGDVLNILSDSKASEFAMVDFTGNKATFRGNQVKGESFTILKSNAGSTMAAVQERDFAVQSQSADGNTDHLSYDLALVGAKTYNEVAFDESWAKVNGAQLKVNSVIKFNLTFPAQVYTLDGLGVKADKNIFFAKNSDESATDSLHLNIPGVDISVKESKFTAYMLTSWHPINIFDTDKITLWAHSNGQRYFVELPQQNLQLAVGQVAEITVDAEAWSHYDMSEGSVYNPVKIKTKADLLAMGDIVAKDYTRYFELAADIDLQGEKWEPINTDPTSFKGIVFDGKGHKISNLTINSESEYASFFGVFMGSLKNVTFENPVVTSNVAKAGFAGVVAALVGVNDGSVHSEIENVTVTGAQLNVTGTFATASGILAGTITSADVKNTSVAGKLTHAGADAECNIGGFVGRSNTATYTDCSSTVDVEISSKARVLGGFAGSSRASIEAVNCTYEGNLTGTAVSYSGLFIGYVAGSKGVFTNCTSEGTFNGADNGNNGCFGGSVGTNLTEMSFTNCDVKGTLNMTATSKGENNGGLLGSCQSPGKISNCDVEATINVLKYNDYVGGLVGRLAGGSANIVVEKCSFNGFIGRASNDRSVVGGLIGYISGAGTIVRNCYTTGEILGSNHSVGGIAGSLQTDVTIENCFSTMAITAGHGVGSIVGRANNNANEKQNTTNVAYGDVIRKCIGWSTSLTSWKSIKVSGNHSFGAIVGGTVKNNTLEDCYRNPALTITAFANDFDKLYDQENANPSTALVWNYTGDYHCPYHGKAAAAGSTVSSVAKTLGWDESIWDLSKDVPTLK